MACPQSFISLLFETAVFNVGLAFYLKRRAHISSPQIDAHIPSLFFRSSLHRVPFHFSISHRLPLYLSSSTAPWMTGCMRRSLADYI